MNVWMKVQWFKVHSKARSRLSLTHLPVQPFSRVKTLDGPRVRVVSPVVPVKEKVYGGKDLLKSQVLSSEWNTERVREDASSDSEDGEDDEMPCVIGESAGDCVNHWDPDNRIDWLADYCFITQYIHVHVKKLNSLQRLLRTTAANSQN